ncbi:MAG: hypothetical protein AAF585_23045, partial [Verrucomicrobiota bacterium]
MIKVSKLLILACLISPAAYSAEIEGEWESADDITALRFSSKDISGLFVADDGRQLPKGYARHGIREALFKPTGRNPHAPTNDIGKKRRHQGLMNIYRVYSATETFGSLRDDEAKVETFKNGATLSWAASDERPAAIDATWTINA